MRSPYKKGVLTDTVLPKKEPPQHRLRRSSLKHLNQTENLYYVSHRTDQFDTLYVGEYDQVCLTVLVEERRVPVGRRLGFDDVAERNVVEIQSRAVR